MKKVLFIAISLIFLTSCSDAENNKSDVINSDATISDTVPYVEEVYKPDYSNPVLMEGSSFGEFFRILHSIGKYDMMIDFTSKDTRDRFGDTALLSFYKEMDFGYEINLNGANEIAGITTLYYTGEIMATKKIISMDVLVENDSTKLILNKLDYSNPF